MAIFKKDSEIERLAKQLDGLKAAHHSAASEAAVQQAHEIAAVQAEIDGLERAEYIARQEARKGEQTQVRADYDTTVTEVVTVAGELRDLLTALDERRKQCAELGIFPPADFCNALQQAITAVFWQWDRHSKLTGAPPKPSNERVRVDTAEHDYADAQKNLAYWRERVESYKGRRQGPDLDRLMRQLDAAKNNVQQARVNLSGALTRLDKTGQASMADRRRQVELLETADDVCTVTLTL